jgi:hypothetical protein
MEPPDLDSDETRHAMSDMEINTSATRDGISVTVMVTVPDDQWKHVDRALSQVEEEHPALLAAAAAVDALNHTLALAEIGKPPSTPWKTVSEPCL